MRTGLCRCFSEEERRHIPYASSITIVDGEVKVSYTPELDDARKALRKYTTRGKKSLLDAGWTEVEPGKEADYNFFKVTVEMR